MTDYESMADREGDPDKQPPECKALMSKTGCRWIEETGGGMEGERYDCPRCGEHFFLDYDEMR